MRTAIIVTNDAGAKAPALEYFESATEAKKAFRKIELKKGGVELWTSDGGRIKRKKFAPKSAPVVGKKFGGNEPKDEAETDEDEEAKPVAKKSAKS